MVGAMINMISVVAGFTGMIVGVRLARESIIELGQRPCDRLDHGIRDLAWR
jgi:hypothetical protein